MKITLPRSTKTKERRKKEEEEEKKKHAEKKKGKQRQSAKTKKQHAPVLYAWVQVNLYPFFIFNFLSLFVPPKGFAPMPKVPGPGTNRAPT